AAYDWPREPAASLTSALPDQPEGDLERRHRRCRPAARASRSRAHSVDHRVRRERDRRGTGHGRNDVHPVPRRAAEPRRFRFAHRRTLVRVVRLRVLHRRPRGRVLVRHPGAHDQVDADEPARAFFLPRRRAARFRQRLRARSDPRPFAPAGIHARRVRGGRQDPRNASAPRDRDRSGADPLRRRQPTPPTCSQRDGALRPAHRGCADDVLHPVADHLDHGGRSGVRCDADSQRRLRLLGSSHMENSLLPRWKAFLAATLAMIVLVGCGARIDTVLTVEKDESGTREMHLTLSESDFEEYVEGSVDDLEAVIKENLPEQLEVSDITTDDGDLKATFTLEFDSPEDYLEKVSALVDDTELQADISVPDTLFVQGVVVEESFTSDELLEWLVIALEDEGLVDSDAASDALDNSGDKELKFGDETEAAHEPFQVSNVQDRGLALVEMETSLLEPGSCSRISRYSMSSEVYEEDPEEVDAFFEAIVPVGGDLEQSSGDPITWTVEFAADDADGLAAKTAPALDSDAVEFSVEQDSSGAQVHTTIVNMADCVNMCSEDAPTITDTLRVPAHWEFDGYAEPDQDHQVVMEEVSATPLEFSAKFGRASW